ncbi:hypothetical protein AZE42_11043 [Rhizopogon vesiculosus]|uniref:Uncharacterized protein n=1 Tax=Rhizopogon vesiculosus TaxID=180088 RepID=A0A1J8PMG0_9AGAM|nr:hypothetical protein AZE42_11043 [Rhizopogon vesiculosus]
MELKFEVDDDGVVEAEELISTLEGGDWEDVPGEDDASPERFNNFDSSSASGTLSDASKLKRRSGMKPFVADATRRTRAAPPRLKHKKNPIDKEKLTEALSTTAHHSGIFVLDIFLRAVRLMRIPLSLFLFVWMLAYVMTRLSGTLRTVFAPMCCLPFVSSSLMCTPLDPSVLHQPKWADFPQLMEVQSSTFDQLLDGSAGESGLSLEIRKAEFATADLTTLVRHSDLKSNDILADLLTVFVKDAKKTAKGLTKLSSKVGGAVDNVMAVNGYAMRTIQDAEKNAPSPYSLTALNPFRIGPTTQEVMVGAFTSAMDTLSVTIQRLILEAEISLHNLDVLEEDLSAIHEAVTRENFSIAVEKSEVLGALWTKLGGNQRKLRDCERRLTLLKDLGRYRKRAQAHFYGRE